jgi:mono/diheme cytochrome c family protein
MSRLLSDRFSTIPTWSQPVPRRRLMAVCAVLSFALALPALAEDKATPQAIEFFEREVRPVLVETCQKCHGDKKQEGALRLDSRAAMIQGGENGPAVVPGQPEKSLLIAAIEQTGDLKMPLKSKLTEPQIAALKQWVKAGAVWPQSDSAPTRNTEAARTHWAFQPVRDPPVPQAPADTNPIDAFVRERLNKAGLALSPPADKRTLIRRATYDLTGLPPTPEEVQAFERDERATAYEELIDRLLASPHYGEQWGRHWLDVARYADTKGYVYAREQRFWVHAWVYRDWVVKALNEDLPYDRFLLLQIAADQASDDRKQLAAMGFLTLGRRFLGVTHDIIDDRIDVVTRGTMGLTVSCARCHDHKYDPIPTRDYYSLYGVFQNCSERLVPIADPPARDAAYAAFEAELQKRQKKLNDTLAQRRLETSSRVRARAGEYLAAQFELEKYPEEGFDQILAKDDILPTFVRRWQACLARAAQAKDPIFVPWHAYAQIPAAEFAAKAAEVTEALAKQDAAAIHPLVRTRFATPPGSMREVSERYGELLREIDQQWQMALKEAASAGTTPPTELADPVAEALRKLLYGAGAPCEVPDEAIVNVESFFDLGSCEELWKIQAEVDNWLVQQPLAPAHAAILEDRPITVNPRVFKRGRPANKGDEVPRQFLELLAGAERKPFERGSGRLELAQAIIDPKNPLTARVMVNRAWLHHFGAGLVRTPSDFGTRAEPPSHPELLDWLTTRFVAEGWSVKRLHRRIMLSDTYRQSSALPTDKTLLAKVQNVDAENRLLWRMNERRLTFEELRDSLLTTTNQLDRTSGGKPGDTFQLGFKRRTLYGLVDRQFLPSTLRVFDFANPDLHIPQRSDTTAPQQALFFLNHPLLVSQSQALAARSPASATPAERVQQLYQWTYQRAPTPQQLAAALAMLEAAEKDAASKVSPTVADWQYGFAAYDEEKQRTGPFTKLPHFTGAAWQGGGAWPDAKLGWVQLTATGGHAGNDLAHAVVRRWTAPRDVTINVKSTLAHDTTQGDGIRGFLVSSRQGLIKNAPLHNAKVDFEASALEMKAGDSLDFIVDIGATLNNDQFTWEAALTIAGDDKAPGWHSQRDFQDQGAQRLSPWEQLAQVLLSANEFLFID